MKRQQATNLERGREAALDSWNWLARLLPESIVARVFTLYTCSWLFCVSIGVVMFYSSEFADRVESIQAAALMQVELAAQTVGESAVIGDYDTIKRVLDTTTLQSNFSKVQFIDMQGGRIVSLNTPFHGGVGVSPGWLNTRVERELSEVNRTISVGGTDYGLLRLTFDVNRIATGLWNFMKTALALGALSFAGGLTLIWFPLRRWLEPLQNLKWNGAQQDENVAMEVDADLINSAPAEFRQTLAALSGTTLRLRSELADREEALASLRDIIANLMPDYVGEAQHGKDIGAMLSVISRLVQEREATRQALMSAKEASDAANQAKSAFLATMSHELRTPMNGILGMAELLEAPDISDRDRRVFARTIHESGDSLLTLLNDILDFSKVEAGKIELHPEPFAPRALLEDAASIFVELLRKKGLELQIDVDGIGDQGFRADPMRLKQMLNNLISNAVKFTERGRLTVAVRAVGSQGPRTLLEFSVTDTGPGIPAEKQALLFNRFSQLDSSDTRRHGGSGLGLSIVRGLALAMEGEVGVKSRPGQGSRFWFRIPAENTNAPVAASEAAANRRPLPNEKFDGLILLADDTPANRLVSERLLARLGVRIAAVADGKQAVDAISQGMRPDLILMDLQMPVMNGLDATRSIRQWESANGKPRIPVIALTAAAFDTDRERCLEAGMDGYLVKPIRLSNLTSALRNWLPSRIEKDVKTGAA